MKRRISKVLDEWRTKVSRTPLVLRGARQVGKTWTVRQLGARFESFVEINLETAPHLHPVFDRHFGDPSVLIEALAAHLGKAILPGKTLLFLDEIQECPSAIKSLRYFKEQLPSLHVVATGSLLEFRLKELGFPVGRAEFQWLFPLCFEEYLWACGVDTESRVAGALDDLYVRHLTDYLLLGGLPEVVDTWIKTSSWMECEGVLQRLSAAYRADFYRYSTQALLEPLRILYDQTPRFWGKTIKFSSLSQEYRSRELQAAIELMVDAGLISKCVHTSANGLPLSAEAKSQQFKLYSLDLGLGQSVLQLPLRQTQFGELVNRGGLVEQFVSQELRAYSGLNVAPELYFWHREAPGAKSEVDFVTASKGKVVPIEAKAGQSGHHVSLTQFLDEKKLSYGILTSLRPAGEPSSNASSSASVARVQKIPLWRLFEFLKQ